jgi:hypothetical protein
VSPHFSKDRKVKSLISLDDEFGIDAHNLAGSWNTSMSREGVAEVIHQTDTFDADWIAYLGAAAAAVQILAWVTVPSLRDAFIKLYPSRRKEIIEEWEFEVHDIRAQKYVRIRRRLSGRSE